MGQHPQAEKETGCIQEGKNKKHEDLHQTDAGHSKPLCRLFPPFSAGPEVSRTQWRKIKPQVDYGPTSPKDVDHPFSCPKHQAEQMRLITPAPSKSTQGTQGCSLLLERGQLF